MYIDKRTSTLQFNIYHPPPFQLPRTVRDRLPKTVLGQKRFPGRRPQRKVCPLRVRGELSEGKNVGGASRGSVVHMFNYRLGVSHHGGGEVDPF